MQKIKKLWLQYSLRKKITIIIAWVTLIMTISGGAIILLTYSSLKEFEMIMNNNAIYQELQEVLKKEKDTFLSYIRNRTNENKLAYETACEESAQCIATLPFDYGEIGEERYARTWNVINGYQGYQRKRDLVIEKSAFDEDYIKQQYGVFEMQDNLLTYALRLVQVTQVQWNEVYQQKLLFLQVMPLIILIVIWIVIVMTFGVWKIIAVTLARPLILVMQDSRKIAQNQFDTPEIYVENEDEIGELVQAFNKMKKAMKRYIHTLEEKNKIAELLYAEEMEKMELEKNLEHTQLEVLKHQVNPHFLFNTLNMISSMARLEDADVTSKMIISLGNLFRYNLRTIEQEVYLEQEIEVLEDYIYIQQMRFDSRICYEKKINVDEKIVKIPSFTLQPIVENAFVHGVLSKESGGKIMLKVWQKEDKVVIVIADNGKGMEKEKLCALNQTIHQKNTSGYGIGLGNICRRINILYTNGSFKIFSKKDMGTIIRMEIPQGERKEEIKDVSLVSSR